MKRPVRGIHTSWYEQPSHNLIQTTNDINHKTLRLTPTNGMHNERRERYQASLHGTNPIRYILRSRCCYPVVASEGNHRRSKPCHKQEEKKCSLFNPNRTDELCHPLLQPESHERRTSHSHRYIRHQATTREAHADRQSRKEKISGTHWPEVVSTDNPNF